VFGVFSFLAFRKARTTLNPHGNVSAIVDFGVYRFSRNPIYLGFALMLVGIPLNGGSLWGLVLLPIFIWSMNKLVIEKEEAYLEKKFREVYTSYKSRVRRWL
jgi:protein-S-isoprenylcysteine O-methyltransferase Ste14